MQVSYTKLKSGEWGIRVQGGTVREGEAVTVTKKSGEKKTETVKKIVFSGNGVILAAVAGAGGGGSGQSGGRSSRAGDGCAACGRGGKLVQDHEDGLMKHYNCCALPPGGY